MGYLLDTHAFLWWIVNDPRLTSTIKEIVGDARNRIFFSAASAWEIAIKSQLGRIVLQDDPVTFVPQQVAANGFMNLAIEVRHALRVSELPMLHRDPFDRMLVAQAQGEGLQLLTVDALIAQYRVSTIW